MLEPVTVSRKSLADYKHIVGPDLIEEIEALAAPLKGKRVLHLSATAYGGGVSEILHTLVPLMSDVGLEVDWQVIFGREEFFSATKVMHNALQGNPSDLTSEQWSTWTQYNEMNARELKAGWDYCIVHDPQPAAIRALEPSKADTWIWRCHIDISNPNGDTLNRLLPYVEPYHAQIFHVNSYAPTAMNGGVRIVPPAIDPLATKNMALSFEDASYICHQFGIDSNRPLICQVSRFDPWKDPLGVIDAYRLVKEEHKDIQLALVGSMASDDPEGWDVYNATIEHAANDPDVHVLNNFNNVGALEVNAFQSLADVVIQKSTREGFGLTVSEALWKGSAFVGGNVGGIPLQVRDGHSGFLVSSVEECAQRTVEYLTNPELARTLGRQGKEHVREHFLMPRYLRDYLKTFSEPR